MKIAFYVPGWPEGPNGIITYVRTLAVALNHKGHEIFILTPDANGNLGFETIVPVRFSSSISSLVDRLGRLMPERISSEWQWKQEGMAIVRAIRDLARSHHIDVLEMEESFGWCDIVSRAINMPVVVRLHGPYFLNGKYELGAGATLDVRRIRREGGGIRSATLVTAPSAQVLAGTEQQYDLHLEGGVVPNPVNLIEDHRLLWSKDRADKRSLLFVGRTDSRKGGDLVLRVFDKLLKTHPDLTLHFVGPDRGFADSGPDVAWSEYLRRHISERAQARIVYHGQLALESVLELRRRCGITLVFSRYETFGMVCAEAMSLGCPLVATRVGGIPEVVCHGETALLADPSDLEDMAQKVAQLLDDTELAARLGEAGRKYCATKLNSAAIADSTLAVYARAIDKWASAKC